MTVHDWRERRSALLPTDEWRALYTQDVLVHAFVDQACAQSQTREEMLDALARHAVGDRQRLVAELVRKEKIAHPMFVLEVGNERGAK